MSDSERLNHMRIWRAELTHSSVRPPSRSFNLKEPTLMACCFTGDSTTPDQWVLALVFVLVALSFVRIQPSFRNCPNLCELCDTP